MAFAGDMNVEDFLRYCKDQGYDSVELLDCFWKETDDEIDKVNNLASELEVSIGCYSIGNDFALPDENKRAEQVEYVKNGIDVAFRLGAPILRVFGGSPKKGVEFEQAFHWITDGFRECTKKAEDNGVIMAMENHGTLSGSARQVSQIILKVKSPNFKATADMANFLLVDENPVEALKVLHEDIAHVHCKDMCFPESGENPVFTSLKGRGYTGCNVGEGEVNAKSCLEYLKKVKYDGMISIEYEGSEPVTGIPASRRFIEEII